MKHKHRFQGQISTMQQEILWYMAETEARYDDVSSALVMTVELFERRNLPWGKWVPFAQQMILELKPLLDFEMIEIYPLPDDKARVKILENLFWAIENYRYEGSQNIVLTSYAREKIEGLQDFYHQCGKAESG